MADFKERFESEVRSGTISEKVFHDMFQHFQERIYSHVYQALKNLEPDPAARARELTMNVLTKAWKQIVAGPSINEAWLYTVADREVINHKKYLTAQKRDVRKTTSLDERITTPEGASLTLGESIGDPQNNPEEDLLKKEWMDRVHESLKELSQLEHNCFLLHYQEGYSYAVIAKLLRTSAGSARTSAHHAKVTLKKYLKG